MSEADDPNSELSVGRRQLAFRKELEALLNRHSMENGSNTPDFILAKYLMGCLDLFDDTAAERERWYGVHLTPGGGFAIDGAPGGGVDQLRREAIAEHEKAELPPLDHTLDDLTVNTALATKCSKCDGCGKVANTNDQEPWSMWLGLPLESSAAVVAGLVRPIACPRCKGTGMRVVAQKEPAPPIGTGPPCVDCGEPVGEDGLCPKSRP